MAEDKKEKFLYDVSFVVVTYNSDWNEMENTLNSIISQEGITFEIIIADDGSKNNYEKELKDYFKTKNNLDYTLVLNKKNQGTVCNLVSGLEKARGEYIKDISPGDYLYGKNTLVNWISYMKKNDLTWSFSDSAYYIQNGSKIKIISAQAHPNDVKPYLKKDYAECRWNYVVLGDIALGAAMLCKTEVQYHYCKKIIHKVKFAEDNIWRIMMFDGIKTDYYPEYTLLYQFGTGVSTSGSKKWEKLLEMDLKNADDIIRNTPSEDLDRFQRKLLRGNAWRKNRILKFFVHGKIKSVLYRKYKARKTIAHLPEEK